MESNDEANRARMEKIFGNPLILNNVLEQLPNSKLLELSLVNKLWKKEARSVMKKRGDVMALLDCNVYYRGCGHVFKDFAADLETFNEVIYSGMTIRLRSDFRCEGTGALELEAIHESIVNGMKGKLTRLSIEVCNVESCWNASDCPIFILLRLLLRDFIGDLEHLELRIYWIMEPFIQQYLPPGSYPKLKVLKLDDNLTSDEETFRNQIRMLVSRAPNLQEIHTRGFVSLRENLIEGREGVVHVHEFFVKNPMKDISEKVIPALRLKDIELYITNREPNLDRWNEKAQRLLRTCCATTLESFRLDASSAVLFMSYGIRLLNVKDLSINFLPYCLFQRLDPQIKSIMTRFDFTYFLPKLESVTIRDNRNFSELSPSEMTGISEQANKAVRREPTLPRACNIKYLYLELSYITVDGVEFFSKVFPAIDRLLVYTSKQDYKWEVFPVVSAWDHRPNLKSITVHESGSDKKLHQRPCP